MAITEIKTGLRGVEDLALDYDGTNATYTRKGSKQRSVTVKRIGSEHIYLKDTTRALSGAADSALNKTNVDAMLVAILAELNQIGIPDDTTVEFSSGTLRVKALGVDTAQLQQMLWTARRSRTFPLTLSIMRSPRLMPRTLPRTP